MGGSPKRLLERNAEIVRLRVEEKLYPFQIADVMGVSRSVVWEFLKYHGLGMTDEERASRGYLKARGQQTSKRMAGKRMRDKIVELTKKGYSTGLIAMACKTRPRNVRNQVGIARSLGELPPYTGLRGRTKAVQARLGLTP